MWIAKFGQVLHRGKPDFEMMVAQQRNEIGRECRLGSFRQHLSCGQPYAPFVVVQRFHQGWYQFFTRTGAQSVNRGNSDRGVVIIERRQQGFDTARIFDFRERFGGSAPGKAGVMLKFRNQRVDSYSTLKSRGLSMAQCHLKDGLFFRRVAS